MHRIRSNGNVSALVDSADGSLDAKYEYGAFGEPLRVGGTSIADDNPFRFSTKYLDSDEARKRVDGDAKGVARRAEEAGALWAMMRQSGLIYYGFRYYSASLGRFLNRDPIGEAGGTNLYAFVENDPVNGWDYLGYAMDYIGGQSCESQCRSYMGEHMYRDFEACMEACEGARSERWRTEFSVENKYHHEVGYYFFWDDYEDDEYLDDRECSESSGRSGVRVIDPTEGMEDLEDALILTLEVASVFDPYGVSDAALAKIYADRDQYVDATLSAVGVVPVLGDAVKWIGKAVYKGFKAFRKWRALKKALTKATETLAHIKKTGNPITYKEYDVNPQQTGVNRGTERIVIGSDGKAYYTDDHYHTFTPIK